MLRRRRRTSPATFPAAHPDGRRRPPGLQRRVSVPEAICTDSGEPMRRRRASLEAQLRKVPLFENLSQPDLAHVARLAVRVREPTGEMLAKEGEPGHEFLIVLEGEV